MAYYQQLIIQTTQCSESEAFEIEEYMRNTIFHSTLDWQTRHLLEQSALKAWKEIQYLRNLEELGKLP